MTRIFVQRGGQHGGAAAARAQLPAGQGAPRPAEAQQEAEAKVDQWAQPAEPAGDAGAGETAPGGALPQGQVAGAGGVRREGAGQLAAEDAEPRRSEPPEIAQAGIAVDVLTGGERLGGDAGSASEQVREGQGGAAAAAGGIEEDAPGPSDQRLSGGWKTEPLSVAVSRVLNPPQEEQRRGSCGNASGREDAAASPRSCASHQESIPIAPAVPFPGTDRTRSPVPAPSLLASREQQDPPRDNSTQAPQTSSLPQLSGCLPYATQGPAATPGTMGNAAMLSWQLPSPSANQQIFTSHARQPPQREGRSNSTSPRHSPPQSQGAGPNWVEGDGYNSSDEHAHREGAYHDMDRERAFEADIWRSKHLRVKRMLEDGNCLFRAVADQVYGDAEMCHDTRQMCIDYMEKEQDHFGQFVTESFTAYCKRKRRDRIFGNNLEIQAMAEMYNRPIHIYSYGPEPINIFHGSYKTDVPPIRLSYHRSNHFNSLVDPSRPAIGAGLGFNSLRGNLGSGERVKAAIKMQQDQQLDNALVAEGKFFSDLALTEQQIEKSVVEASLSDYLAQQKRRHRAPAHQDTSTSAAAAAGPSSSGRVDSPQQSQSQPRSPPSPSAGLRGALGPSSPPDQGLARSSLRSTSNTPGLLGPQGHGKRTSAAAGSPGGQGPTEGECHITPNVQLLLSMGFAYIRVLEAQSLLGDDLDNLLCYLLDSEGHEGTWQGEGALRLKGKAAQG